VRAVTGKGGAVERREVKTIKFYGFCCDNEYPPHEYGVYAFSNSSIMLRRDIRHESLGFTGTRDKIRFGDPTIMTFRGWRRNESTTCTVTFLRTCGTNKLVSHIFATETLSFHPLHLTPASFEVLRTASIHRAL